MTKETWDCPFCKKPTIEVWHKKGFRYQKSTYYGRENKSSNEEWDILCGCDKCGKTITEVKKQYRKDGWL